jgi:hydrogenase/urease accessory protein HupE
VSGGEESSEDIANPLVEAKSLWKVIGLGALTASMCCLPSVVWVLFAGSSAIVAADQLSNDLYFGIARPIFYLIALGMVTTGLIIHFRRSGICTLDEAKRERQRIVNTTLAVLTATFLLYFVWNYIILEIIGIALGMPWAESAIWK